MSNMPDSSSPCPTSTRYNWVHKGRTTKWSIVSSFFENGNGLLLCLKWWVGLTWMDGKSGRKFIGDERTIQLWIPSGLLSMKIKTDSMWKPVDMPYRVTRRRSKYNMENRCAKHIWQRHIPNIKLYLTRPCEEVGKQVNVNSSAKYNE